MDRIYFVTIHADDARRYDGLGDFDLDLVHGSSSRLEAGGTVGGLLTVEQIVMLVDRGYEVTLHQSADERSRALDVIPFDEWLKEI